MRGTRPVESTLLSVRVQPRAARTEVVGWQHDILRVRVAAPPVDGAANRAVLDLVASAFGVPRSQVSLERGARGRGKLVRITGMSRSVLEAKLGGLRTRG